MKKKIVRIVFIVLGIIIIVSGIYYRSSRGNAAKAEIFEVVRGEVSEYVEETGTVKSRSQRVIYSKAVGEIEKINIDEGDYVEEGDILAEIDSEKLNLEIKSLEAQIEGLRATYKEAVKPTDRSKIAQAEAKVKTDKVKLEEAKRNLENSKKLYENGAISYDAHKAIKDNLAVQQNSLEIAENELKFLKKGVSSNIKNQYEAQITELIYQKEVLDKNREELTIKAPSNGIVTEVFIKEGAYLQPGMDIIEIGDTNQLYLEVDVLASEVEPIKEDGLVIIYSEDLVIDELKGRVDKIYPKAFSKVSDLGIEQKRVRIDVDVPKDSKLRIGYEVDSKFRVRFKSDVVIAPDNAVFELENEKFVFILEDNRAVLKKVEIGLEGEDYIEIKSGLKEGNRVIVSPDEDIEEGVIIEANETGTSNTSKD